MFFLLQNYINVDYLNNMCKIKFLKRSKKIKMEETYVLTIE